MMRGCWWGTGWGVNANRNPDHRRVDVMPACDCASRFSLDWRRVPDADTMRAASAGGPSLLHRTG